MHFKAVGPSRQTPVYLPWCQGRGSEIAVGSAGQGLGAPGACDSRQVSMDKLPKQTFSSLALRF